MLTTGQLMTDRLEMSRDPIVARVLPKLIAALDRAITLCERTLAYGRAEEPPPEPRRVDLNAMLDDVADGLALGDGAEGAVAAGDGHRVVASGQVSVLSAVPEGFVVVADPDQLFRILSNLARNAAEAIRGSGRAGRIEVVAERAGPVARIVIADTGPGIPERTREHLFRPFRGSGRQGGTGLGLAIALELATANGGSLELLSTSTTGTRFLLTLPAGGSARLVAA
jgi:signal transduction histidine kinase